MNCLLTNNKLNGNGFLLSDSAQLGLAYTVLNVPTNSSYPANPTPPVSTVGYAVKGTSSNVFAYSHVSFIPLHNVGGTYYWTTNRVSTAIANKFEYTKTFVNQA